jgi:hypothetical protein
VFGDLQPIPASALVHRGRADVTRCLIRFHLPDTLTLIDYDDAAVLQERGVRPSDVVRRDREATQQLALGDFLRRRQSGARGVGWWSYHHPAWRPLALWSDELDDDRWFADLQTEQVEPLTFDHPDLVVTAATSPPRPGRFDSGHRGEPLTPTRRHRGTGAPVEPLLAPCIAVSPSRRHPSGQFRQRHRTEMMAGLVDAENNQLLNGNGTAPPSAVTDPTCPAEPPHDYPRISQESSSCGDLPLVGGPVACLRRSG